MILSRVVKTLSHFSPQHDSGFSVELLFETIREI